MKKRVHFLLQSNRSRIAFVITA